MKDLFFKIKKVEIEGIEYVGIILPVYEKSFGYTITRYWINEDKVIFRTLKNTEFKLSLNEKFKNTRICDDNIKQISLQIVKEAKEEYNHFQKLKEFSCKMKKEMDYIEKKQNNLNNIFNLSLKAYGFLTEEEFLQQMDSIYTPTGYELDFEIKNSKLINIHLEKEYDLGRWLNDSSYSFLYKEYDDNIMVCEHYADNYEFKRIKEKNFKKLLKNKIGKYNVKESCYPMGGGDKRSASIYQNITIYLEKGIELNTNNMPLIKEIIGKLKEILK